MPEVIIPGPEGRIEARYQPGPHPQAPTALILHPHPQFGGTMNNKVVYNLFIYFRHVVFPSYVLILGVLDVHKENMMKALEN